MYCVTRANSVSLEFARKGFLQYKTNDILHSRANSVPLELQEGMGGRSRCFVECCALGPIAFYKTRDSARATF